MLGTWYREREVEEEKHIDDRCIRVGFGSYYVKVGGAMAKICLDIFMQTHTQIQYDVNILLSQSMSNVALIYSSGVKTMKMSTKFHKDIRSSIH